MAAMRGPRLQAGSAAWLAQERSSALDVVQSEIEEFSYSARNELEWLNEHMAGIFDENELNIVETFKTPGKLRGKTPRTARKVPAGEARVPLSNVFAATPNGSGSRAQKQSKRMQSPQMQSCVSRSSPSPAKNSPRRNIFSPKGAKWMQDSGYYGSQDPAPLNIHADEDADEPVDGNTQWRQPMTKPVTSSSTNPFASTTADDTADLQASQSQPTAALTATQITQPEALAAEATMSISAASNVTTSPAKTPMEDDRDDEDEDAQADQSPLKETRSPSDKSSPARPLVRKSSLNFASLPAREPLAAGKSIGVRVSRTSHLDHGRASYYNRHTGGKSLGNMACPDVEEDEMDVEEVTAKVSPSLENVAETHNKTYTQRLQDQISKLGNSQANSTWHSKAILKTPAAQQADATQVVAPTPAPESTPPPRKLTLQTTPGAFPEDDEDDWIEPPPTVTAPVETRPALPKSYSADVMEGIHDKDTVGQSEFAAEKHASGDESLAVHDLPSRKPAAAAHGKSSSVVTLPSVAVGHDVGGTPLTKAATIPHGGMDLSGPSSPTRSLRESPLKQVKNKLSSILKSSKGLLASSAAISAEGKSSMLSSPSTTRLGFFTAPSTESLLSRLELKKSQSQSTRDERAETPARAAAARRTRASAEREKEDKRKEREAKLAADQMDKLEKAREKEREKARVFSKEQEKLAAMEKEVSSKKEDAQLPAREIQKPTRMSPRKAKVADDPTASQPGRDVDMTDAPTLMPPPSAPRTVSRTAEIKRPFKPVKEIPIKTKQAPTVIRVNTGSQHSQFHQAPSNLPTASATQDVQPSAEPQSQPKQVAGKASKAPLHTKTSAQSLKSSASLGRAKGQELLAKKKEQEEREAQRRRDAKAEAERKRQVAQEEQRREEQRRQEQLRRQEQEKQRQQQQQREREQSAQYTDASKTAQRQAAIERAKQTRAPPPAVRSQPNGPPDYSLAVDPRTQEDTNRSVNPSLQNNGKQTAKRVLPTDGHDEAQAKRPVSRGGPSYQAKDSKRRRTSEEHKDMAVASNPPNIKGPPVRPSAGFKKDVPQKSMFQNGYSNAPQGASRDLFKATLTSQHQGQMKASHPLDMAQISKGAIPFAPSQSVANAPFKTPARPGAANGPKSAVKSAKSTARPSPRFQNGDAIELPEIQTDDEDEDEDDGHGLNIATWAESPDLRRALMRQEGIDPSQIFGEPGPLNMEEVFRNKERWPKFRKRTSSANWSGADRLTEEDIRKDLAARDKLRREGGWSYSMSRDLI